MSRTGKLVRFLAFAALVAAVVTELRKPRADREWHGRLAGIVPYELRPPTAARVRERWWNPDDPRLFTEHVFGVGWSVNLARLAGIIRRVPTSS